MGDQIAGLDTSTVISLQKQVAVARVAVDDAKKALKDEKERYIAGDVQALQARLTQSQKELYVLQQSLDDTKRDYLKKLEDKLGVPVPATLSDQSPERLADALVARLGVQPFWGAYQDYVRRLLEGPWEQINKIRGDILAVQQTLRTQEQSLEDLTKGATMTRTQADIQVASGKVETAILERATAVLKQSSAILERDSAAASRDSALREYRDSVRDLLGLTVDRELGSNFYIHLTIGSDNPSMMLEQKLEEHIQVLLGRRLQPELVKDMDPGSLVNTLLSQREGRDHIIDFFLQNKAASSWLTLQRARREVIRLSIARTQASNSFNNPSRRSTDPMEALWIDLLVADRQLDEATRSRDAYRIIYKQLFQDYLGVDLDQSTIIWEEEPPERLLKQSLGVERNTFSISARLRLVLTDTLQTTWSKVQQANLDIKDKDLGIQKADVAIQEADIDIRDAEEAVRQIKNTLDDITTKYTVNKLDAQKQATLSRLRQLQDQLKDAEDRYKNILDDYLNVKPAGSQLIQSPDILLGNVKPADAPGFRRFEKDVVLFAQEIWGQIQKNLEDIGKNERTLKKTREDLADAQKGPDPLLIARREQEVTLAIKNLEDLERKVDGAVLRAPFNGLIRRVNLERGDPTLAYQTIAEIIDLSTLEVEITVDELDLANLVPGAVVQVRMDALPGKVFPGRLTLLNPVPKTVGTTLQYQGKIRVDSVPSVPLYEGMSARVRLEAPLTTPAAAR
ncbi:MAG: secretion protein HlyD family protein [Dehalococcoidia bacterium]|nr:secretion protein HlyD family protein [Dehalococcoidia bacterium]